jgi:hypothetical protein
LKLRLGGQDRILHMYQETSWMVVDIVTYVRQSIPSAVVVQED